MNFEVEPMTPYMMYRGKCKEMSEAAVAADPTLTLVRGFYYDAVWNREEQHWWCKRQDGTIVDPTKGQFPTNGFGDYREHDGHFECAQCGCRKHETEMRFESRYAFCGGRCFADFVGITFVEIGEEAQQGEEWNEDEQPF